MSLPFGTQVAIVDDRPEDVQSIARGLESRHVGFLECNAAPELAKYPAAPIQSINTVFLDLYYQDRMQVFDPEPPANWIDHLIAEHQYYFLVVWSLDTQEEIHELLSELEQLDKQPFAYLVAQKSKYHIGPDQYDVDRLFEEIEAVVAAIPKSSDTLKGQIIAVEDDHVLINCRLLEDQPVFQVRRFDRGPLEGAVPIAVNEFIEIQIITEPGRRTVDFIHLQGDHRESFEQEDYFKGYENSPFNPDLEDQ